ncbi:MAG: Stp1/IreP family PP2C-type Ser/Thr phosphatase [Lachnospiraceae bacterium]|nr:Stp1/IreP family PP2C-type Ser/Thr phosphatase [Lachnospiraceae bacterium]
MLSYGKTDIGLKRSMNQDNVFYSDDPLGNLPNLYIVADGMGGHKAGDYASSYAVRRFTEFVKRCDDENPLTIMKKGIQEVNLGMLAASKSREDLSGMGTTFVVAVVKDHHLYVANIGDSRLYILQKDQIRQITLDHSLVEELIRTGQLDPLKIRNHPEKNIITRALGIGDEAIPDFFELELTMDEQILLCSDGLTNMVEDDEILNIITEEREPKSAVERLIERANYYGGKDNIAALVVTQ